MTTPARGAIAGTPTRSRWRADLFGSGLVETSYGRPAVGVVPGIRLSSMSGGSAGTDGCLYARELRRIGVDYRLHYTVQSEGWSQPMIYSRCGSVARSMPATCRNIIRCSPQVGTSTIIAAMSGTNSSTTLGPSCRSGLTIGSMRERQWELA